MKAFRLPFLLVFLSAFSGAGAQGTVDRMDQLVRSYADNERFNGVVLVARDGEIIYQGSFGFRIAEKKIAHDSSSIFQIGSITKQFTAAVIMQLVREKKLSLSDTLGKFFSGFPNGNRITVKHLLTHTSGLFNYTNDTILLRRDRTLPVTRERMLEVFRSYPPDFEPGQRWNYSNTGYSLLGLIIEKVTGRPYESEVRRRIFQPLGMKDSGFDFTRLSHPSRSAGYYGLSGSILPASIVDSSISYAGGAIYSTAGDLLKWETAISAGTILTKEEWEQVFTPVQNNFGFGWMIDYMDGNFLFMAHGGGIDGFSSFIMRIPGEKLVVIALDNTGSPNPGKISMLLAKLALEQEVEIPENSNEIKVNISTLQKYAGEYQLAPGFSITISVDGSRLKGQATGQPEFLLFAEKENLFFLKVADAKIEFISDGSGSFNELILYQNGMELKGKRIRKE